MEYKTSLVQRNKQLEQTNKNLREVLGVAADLIKRFGRYAKECVVYYSHVVEMCDLVEEYVADTDKMIKTYKDTLNKVKKILNSGNIKEAIEVIDEAFARANKCEDQVKQEQIQL